MYPAGSSPALLYTTVVGPLSVGAVVAGRGLPPVMKRVVWFRAL
jgi:hypothetical protein